MNSSEGLIRLLNKIKCFRFIAQNGELMAMPTSAASFLTHPKFLTWSAAVIKDWRLAVCRVNPAQDESVYNFFNRR